MDNFLVTTDYPPVALDDLQVALDDFPATPDNITGATAVLNILLAEGVDTIFGYPGGAIIPIYDALYDFKDRLNHVLVRHEQGGVHAAQGYARS